MAFRRQRMGRRKVCYFTKNKIDYIDYKDVELLKRFISANGKIIPRRVTGKALSIRENLLEQSREQDRWLYYHTLVNNFYRHNYL